MRTGKILLAMTGTSRSHIPPQISAEDTFTFWNQILRPQQIPSKEQEETSTVPDDNFLLSSVSTLPANSNNRVHFFNNAGASPSPPSVLFAIAEHLALESSVGGYYAASLPLSSSSSSASLMEGGIGAAGDRLRNVYDDAAKLIGAYDNDGVCGEMGDDNVGSGSDCIALVESATVAWTRIFYSMMDWILARDDCVSDQEGDDERVVLVSEAEYAANIVAILKFVKERNDIYQKSCGSDGNGDCGNNKRWHVLVIPSTTIFREVVGNDIIEEKSTGRVDINSLKAMLTGKWMVDYNKDDIARQTTKDTINFDCDKKDIGETTERSNTNGCDSERRERPLNPSSVVMVCVTHIPTNSGIINPVCDIGRIIADHNDRYRSNTEPNHPRHPQTLYLVDACQSVGQLRIDVKKMHCHALTATGRKYLRGPRGTGFLYVDPVLCDSLVPSHVDHAMAPVLTSLSSTSFRDTSLDYTLRKGASKRFEFWESSSALRLGLGAAIALLLDMDAYTDDINSKSIDTKRINMTRMEEVELKILSLGNYMRDRLRLLWDDEIVDSARGDKHIKNQKSEVRPLVILHHGEDDKAKGNFNSVKRENGTPSSSLISCGIVTFHVRGIDSACVIREMMFGEEENERGGNNIERFELALIPPASTPLDTVESYDDANVISTETKYLIRASLHYFNTEEEINAFCIKLRSILKKNR